MSLVETPKRRPALWAALCLAAVILLGAAYVISPAFGLFGLYSAVRSADATRISRSVDFPLVRRNLKVQLAKSFAANESSVSNAAGSPTDQRALSQFLDKTVDTYVTPEGLAGLIAKSTRPSADTPEHADPGETESVAVKPHVAYRDLNHFEVGFFDKSKPSEAFNLVIERRDLFRWVVIAIDLPPAALREIAKPPEAENAMP